MLLHCVQQRAWIGFIRQRIQVLLEDKAFPAVVSKNLSEEQIWHIHEQTRARWGKKRNLNPMAPTTLPILENTISVSCD